jgi:hypothetical protein
MIDDELEQRAHRLLSEAAQLYRGGAPAAQLRAALDRMGRPLRLAVAGPGGAGKSTLVSALVGEEIAPVELPGERPARVVYRDGTQPRAWWQPGRGSAYEIAMNRTPHGLRLSAAPAPAGVSDGPATVVVEWPSRILRRTELADTAQPEPRLYDEADAVLYTTPHLGETDLDFLRAGRGIRGPSVFPVQTLVVLSQADATGGGRNDALLAAKQAARRRRREPRVGALCQDVVAVSPLIALAARTLRPDEFAAITTLAGLPRADADPQLLSTDRFTAPAALTPVGAQQRADLLRRFGLGGIRLAITLTRTGCTTATALGERLQEHSGLQDLQASIAELFTARRATLKARSALTVLDRVLRTQQLPAAAHLRAELEVTVAEAHDFHELRLLSALRAGRVDLPREHAVDARRLLGGSGASVGERLGLLSEATTADSWARAHEAADRWRALAHGHTLTPAQHRAAGLVLQSCDLIMARLPTS